MRNPQRQFRKPWLLVGLALAGMILFAWLGIWQVERRSWKLALIAAVDHRIHAPAVLAPSRAQWQGRAASDWQYRRVSVTGRFRHDRETLVQALTERGSGYWVLTPLVTGSGETVLVNRGFVPPERAAPATRSGAQPTGIVRVSGLLRISEPGGRLLRANRPEQDRWYARDVAAIAKARSLTGTRPYFIDAEAGSSPEPGPVGGLTVVTFPNNHLVYAITWFALALLCAHALRLVLRREGQGLDMDS